MTTRNDANTPLLDALAKRAGFAMTRREALLQVRCARCGLHAHVFRDDRDVIEYRISALCQKCQDHLEETFAGVER